MLRKQGEQKEIGAKCRSEVSLKSLQRKNTPLYQADIEAFSNLK